MEHGTLCLLNALHGVLGVVGGWSCINKKSASGMTADSALEPARGGAAGVAGQIPMKARGKMQHERGIYALQRLFR